MCAVAASVCPYGSVMSTSGPCVKYLYYQGYPGTVVVMQTTTEFQLRPDHRDTLKRWLCRLTTTVGVHEPEVVWGAGVTLLGGQTVPRDGFRVVPRHAPTIGVRNPEVELGVGNCNFSSCPIKIPLQPASQGLDLADDHGATPAGTVLAVARHADSQTRPQAPDGQDAVAATASGRTVSVTRANRWWSTESIADLRYTLPVVNLPIRLDERVRPALVTVMDWTKECLQNRERAGPPWQWYQLMKLREALSELMDGADNVTRADLPKSVPPRDGDNPHGDQEGQPDAVRLLGHRSLRFVPKTPEGCR